jgi:hypothetical protein
LQQRARHDQLRSQRVCACLQWRVAQLRRQFSQWLRNSDRYNLELRRLRDGVPERDVWSDGGVYWRNVRVQL